MLYPSINLLREKADSKYTLVSLAAKRARDLIDGKPELIDVTIDKPVSIATQEIADDLITYSRQFSTEEEAAAYEAEMLRKAAEEAAGVSSADLEYETAEETAETEEAAAEEAEAEAPAEDEITEVVE